FKDLQQVFHAALEHVRIPFCKLASQLFSSGQSVRSQPRVGFEFVAVPSCPVEFGGATVSDFDVCLPGGFLELNLRVEHLGERLKAAIEYDADCFEAATIRRLLMRLQEVLAVLTKSPEMAVGDVPLLTSAEREQVLVTWNNTTAEFPAEKTWVQLFEDRVAASPNAIAARSATQEITYSELNARAEQLASRLREFGIERERLVGVALD